MALSAAQKGSVYQRLSLTLDRECKLYDEYIKIAQQEEASVSALSLQQMKTLTIRREELLAEMNDLQTERQRIVADLGENPQSRLTEIIKKHFTRDSFALLNRKIEKLRISVNKAKRASSELNQVVSFSQRLTNGCLAILASATNNIFRSYSAYGKIKESYHPSMGAKGMRRI